jgi:hypothetical protein
MNDAIPARQEALMRAGLLLGGGAAFGISVS